MADKSTIEWTDATWNPIAGCTRVSEGCRHCYAERFAARDLPGFEGLSAYVDRPDGTREARWTGAIRIREHLMDQPLRWKKPRKIFVNSMSDLFHDAVPYEVLDRIFAVMALCPQHTFQILTKRPERMRTYLLNPLLARSTEALGNVMTGRKIWSKAADYQWPLPNVWLGVSIEDQVTADTRLPYLLSTPAAIRFVSFEPALGFADIAWALSRNPFDMAAGFLKHGIFAPGMETLRPIDQVIVGGESGPDARPMHPDIPRHICRQCAAAGVAFLFKQWGEWASAAYRMSTHEMVFRQFDTFDHWVAKASTWVNGGICLDRLGRQLKIGADFMAARDEGHFPVTIMHRVGKHAAGRLLDGVEHNGTPISHQQEANHD